jgi:HEAT repeat protein
MFEYYKALSQCGSFRSVKVLKKILMESKLTDMFSNMNAVHKKGSALALKILGTEDALIVLRKGLKSMRPDIRLACQFALEKVK